MHTTSKRGCREQRLSTHCIFCYKSANNNDKTVDHGETAQKFINFMKRLVDGETKRNVTSHTCRSIAGIEWLSSCESCLAIIDSLCDLYHQVKYLELQLDWKLDKLVDIMKLASKVPSRVAQLQSAINNSRQDDSAEPIFAKIRAFRHDVIRKCADRLSKSQPRVLVKRLKDGDQLEMKPSADTKSNTKFKWTPCTNEVECFLGWTMTLSAVSLLATISVDRSSKLNMSFCPFDEESVNEPPMSSLSSPHEETTINKITSIEENHNATKSTLSRISNDQDNDADSNDFGDKQSMDNSTSSLIIVVNNGEELTQGSDSSNDNASFDYPKHETWDSDPSDSEDDDTVKREMIDLNLDGEQPVVTSKNNILPESGIVKQETQPVTPFPCNLCQKSYNTQSKLKTHLTKFHNGNMNRKFRCHLCQLSYKSFAHLRNHKHTSIKHQLKMRIHLERQKQIKVEAFQYVEHSLRNGTSLPSTSKRNAMHIKKARPGPDRVKVTEKPEMLHNDKTPTTVNEPGLEQSSSIKIEVEKEAWHPAVKPYNLRTDRKRSYLEMIHGGEEDDDDDDNEDNQSDSSDYMENEEGGESVSTNPQDNIETSIQKTCSKVIVRRVKRGSKLVVCRVRGCRKLIAISCLEEHQKLHEKGQFKCKFCGRVWKTLLRLMTHERNKHSPPSRMESGKEMFCCPRCDFEYRPVWAYRKQFVRTHMSGLDITVSAQSARSLAKFGDAKKDIEEVIAQGALKCSLCSQTFSTFFNLRKHKSIFHAIRDSPDVPASLGNGLFKYICPIVHCTDRFGTPKKLDDHKKLHGRFNCDFCDVVKDYAPDLAIHECEHAVRAESSKIKFNCPRCVRSFEKESFFIRHYLDAHLNLNATREVCSICNMEGITTASFRRYHFRNYHKMDGLKPEDMYRCDHDQCSAYFRKINQLCHHKFIAHYNRKCPECGKVFQLWSVLFRHMTNKHPKHAFSNLFFVCKTPPCFQKFLTEAELNKHQIEDHKDGNNRPHTSTIHKHVETLMCSECGKGYKGKLSLFQHMKFVHTAHSQICPECGKGFKTKLTLQLHLEYHKSPDEWKYQCPSCGRKLASKQKLEQHLRTHTKEKPFICQFCGERYAHRHNWKNHMKTKHKEEYEEEPQEIARKDGNFLSRKGSKKGDCIVAGKKRTDPS